ncbi:Serine/threonine-protein phosphatase activator [Wickerhamomyces ciferrii]|uniref:Serine/threonine-protein phosphatase 2A activator n=1 Tax=Wickerhamomyces ciferrii (strain ATCC 14091 / BCRC 22168 / CBS 111 / JCM 3599 / NBRC 0793 / NRRL Y-1031 F-60-10) TaxID=1206466 RepID=K0KE28_WICCF|nr:Serine/threonine-protein phosphatase activator [Wickerhamomyces ciferrii]CCH40497.1 Serine/threonine-protein phosphatase activator [Wickerhamomyces ciferrii]
MVEATEYQIPQRRILTNEDMEKWQSSATHDEIIQFTTDLADSVNGKDNDAECHISQSTQGVLDILEAVHNIVKNHPVIQDKNTTRFGKVEFRDVYDDINDNSIKIINQDLPELSKIKGATEEVSIYFNESWGNRTRIDYGSGHELNFLAFLLTLNKIGLFNKDDYSAIVLKIFKNYISLMRVFQKEYWLEPAGSHGVWGLDDYHFLPFLFGAAQLSTHQYLRPKSIHNKELVEELHKKYLYLECINFINSIKTASLRWHSPMLDDISIVKTWKKVSEGMIKMYKAEVLGKLPIIQHFFFGSILKAPEGCSSPSSSDSHQHGDGCDHDHQQHQDNDSDKGLPLHQHTWGDCCGIKIPSAFAASESEKTKPIPFD